MLISIAAGETTPIAQLQQDMIDVLNKYNPMLSRFIRGEVLNQFAREMLAKKLIMDDQIINPSYDDIIMTFKTYSAFQNTPDKLANHCSTFIKILKSLGGPLEGAADTINEEWKQVLKS